MAVELLRVTLPLPPSTNNLFKNAPGSGRVVTDEYERWRWEARNAAEWPDLSRYATVPWEVELLVYGLLRGSDLDNRIKAVLDLVASLTGLQDNWCDAIAAVRSTTGARRIVIIVSLVD